MKLHRGLSIRLALSFIAALTCCAAAQAEPPNVVTQHGNNERTGANLYEKILTPANVSVANFGLLFTRQLDASVNGQVLYVPARVVDGVMHNVIYIYTSNNSNGSNCSIYAFDADDPNQGAPLWRTQLPASAEWTTCTPAIDMLTHIMYVLTKQSDDSGPTELHAFDMNTGIEKPGSPITIEASVAGTGDGSSNGIVSFDTSQANCRPGLLVVNSTVYIAFSHNSDSFPYHGWVFGYQYNGVQFTQTAMFCTDPNGGLGGIWMAGMGLAADAAGNIYCGVGNGTFDVNTGGTSYGMSVLKLTTPGLAVADWYCPSDELENSNADLDFGSAGVIGIPGTQLLFTGATKFGSAFLVNSANLGHFAPGSTTTVPQRIDNLSGDNREGQNPVCWNAGANKYIYLWPGGSAPEQLQYQTSAGKLNPAGIYKQASDTAGGSLAVSANGATNGILWAVGSDNIVRALPALDISTGELWDSSQNATRDGLTSVGHWQFPTVVNGKVYVPTGSSTVEVYGLLPTNATSTLTPVANAYVQAGSFVNDNFGGSTELFVKKLSENSKQNVNRAAYLKFDLTGLTRVPFKATLTLTTTKASSPAGAVENIALYDESDSTWTENGITWNNAPGLNRGNFTSTATPIRTQGVTAAPGSVSIDVTAFVAAHVGDVVTIQMLDASAQNILVGFSSREAGANGPQLTLTF